MNKGDTILIEVDLTLNDKPLEKDSYDEIEIQFNKQKGAGSLKLLLSAGDIVWDFEREKYIAMLSQEETFDMPALCDCQVRICKGAYVASSDIIKIDIGEVLSREVLYGD